MRRAAWVACAAAAALTAVMVTLLALACVHTTYEPSELSVDGVPDTLMNLVYLVVGVVVTLKRPLNLVGWALVLAGLGSLVGDVGSVYSELALFAHPDARLPGGAAVAAFAVGSWIPLMAGVFLLLATFPSGTVGTRWRRRWIVAVLAGFASVWVLLALGSPTLDPPFDKYANPLVLPGAGVILAIAIVIDLACLGSVFVAGVDLVRRFRRSSGVERQQFKWLAWSGGLLVATLPIAGVFNWSQTAGTVFTVALTALPVSVSIAVLRYRLFEIDRLVSRTITYGLLTIVLGAAYVGLVLAGQALSSSFAGGSNLAIAVSTLVVAALFLPLRSRIQSIVDRRFNRRRYDAQRTLEAFGVRLREQVELEALTGDLRTVVGETMQPAHTSLWLRSGLSR